MVRRGLREFSTGQGQSARVSSTYEAITTKCTWLKNDSSVSFVHGWWSNTVINHSTHLNSNYQNHHSSLPCYQQHLHNTQHIHNREQWPQKLMTKLLKKYNKIPPPTYKPSSQSPWRSHVYLMEDLIMDKNKGCIMSPWHLTSAVHTKMCCYSNYHYWETACFWEIKLVTWPHSQWHWHKRPE